LRRSGGDEEKVVDGRRKTRRSTRRRWCWMAKAMNEVDAGRDRRGLFQCKRLEVKGVKGLEEEVCVCVCVCVCVY
jgi:hypothetical protein